MTGCFIQTPVPPAYQPDGVEYGAAPVSIQSQGRPAVSPAYPQDAASASEASQSIHGQNLQLVDSVLGAAR